MLGIMGNVDQQVNDKADSMQMQGKTSTVSKDLLDVMATQKIAREKDVALKELQMAQQQNPNTIKDQLEQKVMGMTPSEMTNQTAGHHGATPTTKTTATSSTTGWYCWGASSYANGWWSSSYGWRS